MTLREMFNLGSFCLLLKAGYSHFTFGFSTVEAVYYILCILPWLILLLVGEAYGIAFAVSFMYGGGKASRGYSRERSWAREGKGREVAHALLWRDRLYGDNEGLMAVIGFAQKDPDLKPEALRAALRLLGRHRISKADRDHVGRLLMQAQISVAQPHQKRHH
jgi:hypothetical protein